MYTPVYTNVYFAHNSSYTFYIAVEFENFGNQNDVFGNLNESFRNRNRILCKFEMTK